MSRNVITSTVENNIANLFVDGKLVGRITCENRVWVARQTDGIMPAVYVAKSCTLGGACDQLLAHVGIG